MPWIKRERRAADLYWIVGAVAAVVIAAVIGYEWGHSSSIVGTVEKHLSTSEALMRDLEQRIQALETKLGVAAAADNKSTAKLQ